MTHTLIEFGIAALSLLTCVRFFPRLLAFVRDRHTRWLSLALLVLIAGGMLGDTTFLTNVQAFKLLYAVLFLVLVFASLAAPALRRSSAPSLLPLFLILIFWAWLFAVNTLQNSASSGVGELLLRLAPGTLWIALLAIWRRSPISREMLAVVAAFALTIPGFMLPFIGNAWRACDEFKCGMFDGMLVGAYGSENYLSQQATVILVLNLIVFGLKGSLPLIALAAALLLSTESRTAQYALLLGLAIAALAGIRNALFKSSMRPGSSFIGQASAFLAPAIVILIAVQLALSATPEDFSNRGNVWMRAVALLKEEPLIGFGIDRWTQFQQTGLLPSHFPHSLYVFVAFSGGIVGLILLFFWLSQSLITTARQTGRSSPSLILGAVFMTLGLLEVVWNPIAVDGTSWIPLALMAVSEQRQHRPDTSPENDMMLHTSELQK